MEGNVVEAADREEWDKVKDLVDRGGDVNLRDGMGRTALHHAARHTNVEMCKFLLGRGADVAARDKDGDMAISRAIFWSLGSNCVDVVRLLLTDVTVNAVNNDGRRLLHYAALHRGVDIVQLLVDHGAHTNVVDNDGNTPLHEANGWGDDVPAVTTILLHKEAKVDAVNKDGNQPLHVACMKGNIKSARLLLSSGASSCVSNNYGKTPLHCAAGRRTECVELCDILLTHDADIHATDNNGNQPLHLACMNGNIKSARLLLSSGASSCVSNNYGKTPLHCAAGRRTECVELCDILLTHDADIHATDNNGNQPLHLACMNGNIKSARLLLSSGASSCASNNDGKTPLHCAAGRRTECVELCDILLTHDADIHATDKDGNQPLHLACMKGNIKFARLLLSSGASSCASNNDGKTPLHCAAGGRTDCVELCDILLTHDADIHAADKDGNQPLHIACKESNNEIGKVLISHGADVVAINGQNLSPFKLASGHCPDLCLALSRAGLTSIQTEHICQVLEFAFRENNQLTGWVLSKISTMAEISVSENLSKWIDTMDVDELLVTAIGKKQMDTCMLLIENGASVNGTDRYDIRPLTYAVKEGQFNLCKLLIEQGASVNAKGYTCKEPPIYYALTGNKTEIVKLLLSHGAEFMNVKVGKRSALERSQTTGSRPVARILNCAGIYHVFVITTCILINII